MWAGVILANGSAPAIAVALQLVDQALPQPQQEALETVVAAAAVAMVTFMIVWMRRHARDLAADLRAGAAGALARGSALALVGMAFFAVVREGIETAVFLLAAFQASGDATSAGAGALAGILVAVAMGAVIYRGGVRLNLGRFFRVTAAVLVVVAAGLVASAIHTAHEATWLNGLQGRAVDLSWLIRPGSVTSVAADRRARRSAAADRGEAIGWLIYLVPMMVYRPLAGTAPAILRRAGRRQARLLPRTARRRGDVPGRICRGRAALAVAALAAAAAGAARVGIRGEGADREGRR